MYTCPNCNKKIGIIYKLYQPVLIPFMCEKCFFKELEKCGIIPANGTAREGSIRKIRKDNKR